MKSTSKFLFLLPGSSVSVCVFSLPAYCVCVCRLYSLCVLCGASGAPYGDPDQLEHAGLGRVAQQRSHDEVRRFFKSFPKDN